MKSIPVNKQALITLTTDFGAGNHFSGVMHGVIQRLAPLAQVIDLCHTVRHADIRQAARLIRDNYRYFAPGTIHVVVVDPGVGSPRRIVLLQAAGHYFLAPDNGILHYLAATSPDSVAWDVKRPDLYLSPPHGNTRSCTSTFHGRDIFAPIAARLATGYAPQDMGRQLDPQELLLLKMAEPRFEEDKYIVGEIIDIDHFGNIISNITSDMIDEYLGDSELEIELAGHKIKNMVSYYDEAAAGEVAALFNSDGYLEVAVNLGRASDLFTSVETHGRASPQCLAQQITVCRRYNTSNTK